MNIPAKIWSTAVSILGMLAFFGSMAADEFDGYAMLGGLIFLVTGVVALTYIWKDDEVQKQAKQSSEEDRIARIVAERIQK